MLGEKSFSQIFECGGGVCLCSVSPSLPVRIRTAWWYSLLLSLTFLIDTSIQTPLPLHTQLHFAVLSPCI